MRAMLCMALFCELRKNNADMYLPFALASNASANIGDKVHRLQRPCNRNRSLVRMEALLKGNRVNNITLPVRSISISRWNRPPAPAMTKRLARSRRICEQSLSSAFFMCSRCETYLTSCSFNLSMQCPNVANFARYIAHLDFPTIM